MAVRRLQTVLSHFSVQPVRSIAGNDVKSEHDQPRWWWSAPAERYQLLQIANDPKYQDIALSVYSRRQIRKRLAELTGLQHVDRVFFAIKANYCPEVLKCIYDSKISGFECVSLAEIRYMRKLFPDAPLLFTPNFAPKREYEAAFKISGVIVTLDNTWPIYHWKDILKGQRVFIRVDPGEGDGFHRHVITGGKLSKFGVSVDELVSVLPIIEELKLQVIGLHVHKGSGIQDLEAWKKSASFLASLRKHFPYLRHIDIGGGLGIPYRLEDKRLDLQALDQALKGFKAEHKDIEIWLEPGRYIVCESGVILTKVTQLKEKAGKRFVGIDTGMNALIRPSLYSSWHYIVNLSRLDSNKGEYVADVVGPICETGDVIGFDRNIPADTTEGDVMLLACTGAYGNTMASNYNMRGPALEITID